ncbi:hypothetical protein BHU72_06555 [Desulfuribacillus stibiiarsenatis]|uniref:Sigma-54 factor interaction domain-containing protein n=1 Tax=Desulfuribacillus stibiiarsenatis TaxID=1390249 RepID=A0A1E5L436_9FIRM|nr:helix-turn-helix domain-containing protein [Desulfuribacillus stibiiarsenatis]OEH84851.1 hypothetical protein BHU72_06555 [Desulfuribacillus stibiiarsenatis]
MQEQSTNENVVPYSFFQSVIDILPIAVDIITHNRESVLTNGMFHEYFSWLKEYPFQEQVDYTFQNKTPYELENYEIQSISGDLRAFHLLVEPILEGNEVLGAIVIVQDVTMLAKFNQENEKLQAMLETTKAELRELKIKKASNAISDQSVSQPTYSVNETQKTRHSDLSEEAEANVTKQRLIETNVPSLDPSTEKDEGLYLSTRDNNTWIAVRDLKKYLKASENAYIYGEPGVGVKELLYLLLTKSVHKKPIWHKVSSGTDLDKIPSSQLNNEYHCIEITNLDVLQIVINFINERKQKHAQKHWLIFGSQPLTSEYNERNEQIAHIDIPSIRQRKVDIMPIVDQYIPEGFKLDEQVKRKFIQYNWPQNLREIRSVIRYAVGMCEYGQRTIELEHIQPIIGEQASIQIIPADHTQEHQIGINKNIQTDHPKGESHGNSETQEFTMNSTIIRMLELLDKSDENMTDIFETIEKQYIEKMLDKEHFNISRTANKLGIKRQALQYKMKKYNLASEE